MGQFVQPLRLTSLIYCHDALELICPDAALFGLYVFGHYRGPFSGHLSIGKAVQVCQNRSIELLKATNAQFTLAVREKHEQL